MIGKTMFDFITRLFRRNKPTVNVSPPLPKPLTISVTRLNSDRELEAALVTYEVAKSFKESEKPVKEFCQHRWDFLTSSADPDRVHMKCRFCNKIDSTDNYTYVHGQVFPDTPKDKVK